MEFTTDITLFEGGGNKRWYINMIPANDNNTLTTKENSNNPKF